MNRLIKIIPIAIFFLNSCQPKLDFKEEGFIELRGRIYDSSSRQYIKEDIMPDMKIWYKSNFIIEEIKTIKTSLDSRGNRTKETPIAYYLFMDRNTKMFYHYSAFSDTARLLDQYRLADTSEMKGLGGWGFYKDYIVDVVGTKKYIVDTSIDGVIYKRILFDVKEGDNILPTVRYLRCDKPNIFFTFNKSLSKELGCPIVRIDYLPTPTNLNPSSSEIVFIRNNLSKEEVIVFNAWEKNIKKYPVIKSN
jgi:hypothetical protein